MTLLFRAGEPEQGPSGSSVLWTWLVWLPIAMACFYVAWGYASAGAQRGVVGSGIELALLALGLGTLVRAGLRTRRWLKRGGGRA